MSSIAAESSGRTAPRPAADVSPLRFLTLPRVVFGIVFMVLLFKTDLSDPDYYWHLKTGEYIATHRALFDGDPFSYTFAGKPWAPHEWLFQLGLYGVFAVAGAWGVKVAVAGLGTAAVHIAYRTANRLLGGSSVALVLAAGCFVLLSMWFVPRPHLVTYVLVATFVDRLIAFRYFGDDRRLWLLVPMMILWTNVHGAFVIGIALLALFCACEWVAQWGRDDPAYRRRLVRLSLVAVCVVIATAVNPSGLYAWLWPASLLGQSWGQVVGEFTSPDFHDLYGKFFLVVVFAFFVISIYRRNKPDLTEMAFPLCSLFIGFTAMRHVPIALLMLVPFFAVALRDGPVQRLYGRLATEGRSLGNREYVLNAVLLCAVGATLVVLRPMHQIKEDAYLERQMPVKAVDFVRSHGITGRMFNDYTQGGYLIYHLAPQKVFIDGRADIYGYAFVNEFRRIWSGEPGWQKAFDAHAIDYVLVPRTAPIRDLLRARGDFRLVYDDATDSVLVRASPRFDALPTLAVE